MPSEYENDLSARVGLDTTEWKKGIADLNAGIKHIETGFQASAALMDDWSNSSEGLNKRLSSLNEKLELQKKKLAILKQAYEEEVAANGESSKAAEELGKKMYSVKAEIDRTQSSVKKYTVKLNEMTDTTTKTANKLNDLSSKTRTLSLTATAGLAALGAGLVKAGQTADELNTLAKQTGLTTAEIQKFKYASDIIDVSLDDLTGALRKMTRNMISTSAEVKGAWDTLGISTVDADGHARDAIETFYDVLEALSEVKNETERDQLAMLIFGKSANDLAGIVDDGGAALRQLGREAESLGLIMSQDAIDGANEFNDVIDKMKATVSAELGKAFSENAAELTETMQSLANVIVSIIKFFADLPAPIQKGTVAIMALTAALSPVLKISSSLITTYSKLKTKILEKTTATVADTTATTANTAATKANSNAAKTSATALNKAGTAVKSFGAAVKAATPLITAITAAIGIMYSISESAKQETVEMYDALIEKNREAHEAELEQIESSIAALEEETETKKTTVEEYYKNKISYLDEDLKAQKQAIESEQELYERAYKERIGLIEQEHQKKLQALQDEKKQRIQAVQTQIDALEKMDEEEEKREKNRENEKKLAELQKAIADADTYSEKVEAEEEYADFVRELERENEREKRAAQIKELENQIELIEEECDNREEQYESELDAVKKLEEEKYQVIKSYHAKRLQELEGFVERQTLILTKAMEEEIDAVIKETEAEIAGLESIMKIKSYIALQQADYLNQQKAHAANKPFWMGGASSDPAWMKAFKYKPSGDVESSYDALSEEEKNVLSDAFAMNIIRNLDVSDPKAVEQAIDNLFGNKKNIVDKISNLNNTQNANGTNFWRGGPTGINEMGGEIINLPRGTQIIPHDVSVEFARAAAQASITNTTTNNTTNNYGAQQQVTVLEVSGKKVATVVEPAVSVRMSNNIYGRRRSGGR